MARDKDMRGICYETHSMMKKVGCREEGRRRQVVYTDGSYWDEILFGMTRDEFEAFDKERANDGI